MAGRSSVLAILLPLWLVGCLAPDRTGGPDLPPPVPAVAVLTCSGDVTRRALECTSPASAAPSIIGGQGVRVALRSSDVSFDDGTDLFKAAVSVQNLTFRSMGTEDGATKDTNGVKVFFPGAPVGLPSGVVSISNAYTGDFTATGQSYFKYDTLLATQVVSDTQYWHFQLDPATTSFTFTVLVYAAMPTSGGVVQWMVDPTLTRSEIWNVAGFGSTGVVMFGGQGAVWFRNGSGWSSRPDPLGDDPELAADPLVAHGADDVYYRTSGGMVRRWDGISWRSVGNPYPGGPAPNEARALATTGQANDLWAFGAHSVKRFDGSTWANLGEPPGMGMFASLHAATSIGGKAYVADDEGQVWRHDGTSWEQLGYSGATDPIFFVGSGPDDLWLMRGGLYELYHWDGTGWSGVATPDYEGSMMAGAAAPGPDDFYIFGSRIAPTAGRVWHWDGSAWTKVLDQPEVLLRGLWARHANELWAVGTNGTELRRSGGSWTSMSSHPGPQPVRTVWVASDDDVFAGTGGGKMFRWNGAEWSLLFDRGGTGFSSIWGGNDSEIWMVGNYNYNLYRWNGTTVDTMYNFDIPGNIAVGGFDPLNVWVVGAGGGISKWNGTTSHPSFTSHVAGDYGTTSALNAIWAAAGTSYAVAVGNGGVIYQCDCSIPSWGTVTSPTGADLNGVWGNGPSSVWAVGSGGVILRYDGVSWTTFPSPTSEDLYAIWGGMADDVYAAGASGTVIHYNGVAWTLLPRPPNSTSTEFRGIHGTQTGPLYLAGSPFVRGLR
jgi:hypothetical protein